MKNIVSINVILSSVILQLLFISPLNAQWVFFPCDTTNSNAHWSSYFHGDAAQPGEHYLNITSETADKVEGSASMKIEYKIQASEGWGGYEVRAFANDLEKLNSKYDLSSGKYLSYWYKTISPVNASKPSNDIHFELKLKEKADPNKGEDRWVYENKVMLGDASNEWHQVIIPLERKNWILQEGDDNKTFDPWAVFGFEVAFVYIIDGTTETASGTILLDKLQILGNSHEPVISFNEPEITDTTYNRNRKDGFWKVSASSNNQTELGKLLSLSQESVDTVQGSGSLRVKYNLFGGIDSISDVWFEHQFNQIQDFTNGLNINFYFKNISQTFPESNTKLFLNLYEEDNCGTEIWTSEIYADLTKSSDWTFVRAFLNPSYYFKSINFVQTGKKIDGYLNLRRIGKIGFEIRSINEKKIADESSAISTGEFLLDNLQISGTDVIIWEPFPITISYNIVAAKYKNLIRWEDDVPEFRGKLYNIYGNIKPFSYLNDRSILNVAMGIPDTIGYYEQILYAPLKDRKVTNYIFVYPPDFPENYVWGLESITNISRGIPVISNIKPNGFHADGDLTDWQHIDPFVVKLSDSSGHQPEWSQINTDSDLWYKSWVSLSEDSLFVAFEVHDDIIFSESSENDYADLMIGLYTYRGKNHNSLNSCSGKTSDYQFRFMPNKVIDFRNSGNIISTSENFNYSWKKNSDTTYVIEWGIGLNTILDKIPADEMYDFFQKKGMRLALDLAVYDSDISGSQDGLLTWSPIDNEPGLENILSWGYSWLGNKNMSITEFESFENYTDVNEPTIQPFDFSLEQNYPNPFNPETRINFSLKSAAHVSIKVYNVLGAEITTLIDDFQSPGKHTLSFNAVNLASGVYFFKMTANGFSTSRKMMLLK